MSELDELVGRVGSSEMDFCGSFCKRESLGSRTPMAPDCTDVDLPSSRRIFLLSSSLNESLCCICLRLLFIIAVSETVVEGAAAGGFAFGCVTGLKID